MTEFRANVPCGSCQLCCHHDVIMLFPEKGDDVSSYEHEYRDLPMGRVPILKKGASGNCVYLGTSGCTIHDRAPAICRVFDCRRWYLSKTRTERRVMVKLGMADQAIFDAGRERLASLQSDAVEN